MDQCGKGPNVMAFPQNTWYYRVRERDLPEILDAVTATLDSDDQ
jgi:(2Fe-2S) ferredoxin